MTLWYPLVEGIRIVTFPSPLDAAKNAALIEQYKLTFLLATPTFLRGYIRKAEPQQLRSLRLVITGAEKLPLDLAKSFEEHFGQRIFEGYGLTETSPVVSVNLPDPQPAKSGEKVQPSSGSAQLGKWRRELRPKFGSRRATRNFRCMTQECCGCAAPISSKVTYATQSVPLRSYATAG